MVGDSLTVIAAPAIDAALQPDYTVDIAATVGYRIDQELPALRAMLGGQAPPRDVIVNLGTNDATSFRTHPDWRSGFDEEIALLSHVECVVLVTVNTNADLATGSTVAADINAAIAEVAASRPNFHVLDWDRIVHSGNGAAWLTGDSIHLTAKGKEALAEVYRSALQQDCRPS